VVIAQNHAVQADEAVMQRIVHLEFDKHHHSRASKPLAERLSRMPMEAVSGFLLKAIAAEKTVLATMKEMLPIYEKKLLDQPTIKSTRIAKNHAQIMALMDGLAPLIGLNVGRQMEVLSLLTTMAAERQRAIGVDHPLVEAFWEQIEHLQGRHIDDSQILNLNHSNKDGVFALNLVEYEAGCKHHGLTLPCTLVELKKLLKTSQYRKFSETKSIYSAITGRSVRCWLFQYAKPKPGDTED